MDTKKLINWRELSSRLSLSKDTMRANRVSGIHKEKVEELLSLIEGWEKKHKLK